MRYRLNPASREIQIVKLLLRYYPQGIIPFWAQVASPSRRERRGSDKEELLFRDEFLDARVEVPVLLTHSKPFKGMILENRRVPALIGLANVCLT